MSFFAITYGPDANNGVSLVTDNGTSYTGYPAFVVTPPTTLSQQKDIGVASALDHTQTDGSVPLTFNHAMSKVKFSAKYTSLTGADLNVSIEKIEFTNLYRSNTLRIVDLNPGFQWDVFDASNNPTRANYTLTQTDNTLVGNPLTKTSTTISTEDGTLMLIPQKDPSEAKLKVSFKMYGIDLEREVELSSINFAPGESYVYALNLEGGVWNYNNLDAYQTFTAPKDGTYRLEAWGASGSVGYVVTGNAGAGGYCKGDIILKAGQTIYIYVGSQTPNVITGAAYTFNGGGRITYQNRPAARGGIGGGATDFRLKNGDWDNATSLNSRIMVAGGGGGGGSDDVISTSHPIRANGGYGGGLTVGEGISTNTNIKNATGGTQTSGGTFTDYNCATQYVVAAMFGKGGAYHWFGGGGGGGGYYGGGVGTVLCGNGHVIGGGGSSSFISGMAGCVAIDPTNQSEPRTQDTGSNTTALNYSSTFGSNPTTWSDGQEILFTNPSMIDGEGFEWNTGTGSRGNQTPMPTYSNPGTFMTGNTDHGHARITFIN